MNSEEMERFGEGATLPSEVKLAKSKSLYNFEVVNKILHRILSTWLFKHPRTS